MATLTIATSFYGKFHNYPQLIPRIVADGNIFKEDADFYYLKTPQKININKIRKSRVSSFKLFLANKRPSQYDKDYSDDMIFIGTEGYTIDLQFRDPYLIRYK